MADKKPKIDTTLIHAGSHPEDNFGIINPPVYHASTVAHPSVAAMREKRKNPNDNFVYGRRGTPTAFAFEEAVAQLEGGDRTIAVGSGLASICGAMLAFVGAGDHALVTDNAYAPTRNLANKFMSRYGVEITYYDPMIGGGIADLMRPNTKVVYTEAPGSHSFEVQDIPAIAEAAHAAGAKVVMDNTWSGGYHFKPFEHGVDVSVHAATKYLVGHSDAMLGAITMKKENFEPVINCVHVLGYNAAPDDAYLGLRGIRTLSARMARHQANGLKLAEWFAGQPEVHKVLHPALPSCPGHEIWKRDFTGSSGLFSVVFNDYPQENLEAMIDGLELFALGGSWGGFESLVLPSNLEGNRTATKWETPGPCVRFHAGLEDADDLIEDLAAGLKRLSGRS
mgnify:CR=1 FL=1